MKLSIISPVYRAEKMVDELVKRISEEVEKITSEYEIILVEDGSPDNSWQKIEENALRNTKVKGIKLSRNFGQHYAITAGIDYALGDYAIIMDCDLQDNPVYINTLYQKALEGYDIIYTSKETRKHGFFKNITAKLFNSIFNWLVDNKSWKASSSIGSYSLISNKVVDAYKNYHDYRRHYLMVLRWLGFKSTIIPIKHEKRLEGKSSYNLKKLINHAIDGITSQSDKLLRLTISLGFILSGFSFIAGLFIIIRAIFNPFQPGWASLSVLLFFIAGLIITSIGVSAIYIGKIFEQTKGRPLYIIEKKLN